MKVKKLCEWAKIPTRAHDTDAGYDLYADRGAEVAPGCTEVIKTGIAIAPPHGYFGAIFARSGLATRQGLRPANCVGVVDENYRGEVMVALHNDSQETRYIQPGDRIAQLVFLPYFAEEWEVVDELDETDRGAGGFGSTGAR